MWQMTPCQKDGILGVVCMWFPVWSKFSCSCGVEREKGLLGSHLNNCPLSYSYSVPITEYINQFQIIQTHFVTEIIAHFIDVLDEKKCSLLYFPIILGDVKNSSVYFFINFVLISSGKTKFSMASCLTIHIIRLTLIQLLTTPYSDPSFTIMPMNGSSCKWSFSPRDYWRQDYLGLALLGSSNIKSFYNRSKIRCTGKMVPPDENFVNAHSQHRQNFSSGPGTSNFWTVVVPLTILQKP